MLWISPPAEDEGSPLLPLGAPRQIKSVYDSVIVGSDGTPTSLVAVGYAAGVAHEPRKGIHQTVYGREKAEAAMVASVKELERDRTWKFEQRVVAAEPAKALLEVAGDNPKNLIVVGNRGSARLTASCSGRCPAMWSRTLSATSSSSRRRGTPTTSRR